MGKEVWRPIYGFEQWYEVSNAGRVRSLPRTIPGLKICWQLDPVNRPGLRKEYTEIEIHRRGKVLSPRISPEGYRSVSLYVNRRPSMRYVHRLVLEAFAGPEPKLQAAHLNGTPGDDRLENLAWVTPRVNSSHRILHGTEKRNQASFELKQRAVQVLGRNGFTPAEIAVCLTLREPSVQRQLASA